MAMGMGSKAGEESDRVDLSEYQSFKELAADKGIRPPPYGSNLGAMEAVEIMAMACQSGDRVLALARQGRVTPERAESLIAELLGCYARPAESVRRVIEIRKELRGLEG
jgi:hypothetical protein